MNAIISTYRSVFSEGKYIFLLNITDKVFSFVILLLIAREYSTGTYGEVVTLITLSTVLITVFDFGLPIFLQREISLERENASAVFSKVFTVSLIIFILYMLSGFIFFKIFYNEISTTLFAVISLMIYTSSLVTICNRALSGINDFKSQFTAFVTARVLITAFFIAAIYYFVMGINILMFGMFVGFTINLFITLRYLLKSGIKLSLKYFSAADIRNILKLSIPLGLAVIFNFLYDKIDVILISQLRDFTEVAFYTAGYGLFKAGTLSFSFLLAVGFTKVSAISKNKAEVILFFRQNFKLIFIICAAVNIILFFLAEYMIIFFYTEKFMSSIIVLKILSFGMVAIGLNNLTGIVINGMGYFKIVMYITLYALIMNVLLNILLIPEYGIIAASFVTVLTEYFIFFTEYYYLRKIFNS